MSRRRRPRWPGCRAWPGPADTERLQGPSGHSEVLSLCVNEEKAPGLIQILCRLRDRWVSQQDKYAFVGFEVTL